MIQLTNAEALVIQVLISRTAISEGEDIIGLLMRHGAFHVLGSEGQVTLAIKLGNDNYAALSQIQLHKVTDL